MVILGHFFTIFVKFCHFFSKINDFFRNCDTSQGKRLIDCNKPEQEKKYTVLFQDTNPSPYGLEFLPGQTYYYICKYFHQNRNFFIEKNPESKNFHRKKLPKSKILHQKIATLWILFCLSLLTITLL